MQIIVETVDLYSHESSALHSIRSFAWNVEQGLYHSNVKNNRLVKWQQTVRVKREIPSWKSYYWKVEVCNSKSVMTIQCFVLFPLYRECTILLSLSSPQWTNNRRMTWCLWISCSFFRFLCFLETMRQRGFGFPFLMQICPCSWWSTLQRYLFSDQENWKEGGRKKNIRNKKSKVLVSASVNLAGRRREWRLATKEPHFFLIDVSGSAMNLSI
jgi:hypothetical protein